MSVIRVEKDREHAKMTVVVALDATVDQVWQLWADPRKLERWWGPPTWPATFSDFTLKPGERASYVMTGPEGEKAGGWWNFTKVQAPNRLELTDGFANDDGSPNTEIAPMTMVMTLEDHNGATHMELVSSFVDQAHFDEIIAMGAEEGLAGALGQMDALVS